GEYVLCGQPKLLCCPHAGVVQEDDRAPFIRERPQCLAALLAEAAGVLLRHRTGAVAVLDGARGHLREYDYIEAAVEIAGDNFRVGNTAEPKTDVVQQPSRPALVHAGLIGLVDRNTGLTKAPQTSCGGKPEFTGHRVAINLAARFP